MKLYTVQEFARIKNVSASAVYKQINKGNLKEYIRKTNEGLRISGKYFVDNPVELVENFVDNSVDNDTPETPENPTDNEVFNSVDNPELEKIIEHFMNELSKKDEEIRNLSKNLENRQNYIEEQGRKIIELLEHSQQLQAQSNQLQANIQLLLSSGQEEQKKKNKPGFFKRIFSRKNKQEPEQEPTEEKAIEN